MLSHHYMSDVLVLLLAAVLVVSLFRFIKASPVLGYLISGLLIGPHALGFISHVERAKSLGEFGVVFLLFTLGLKVSFQKLASLKKYVFGLGLAQVIITGAVITACIMLAGLSAEASVLIGCALSLSSTAVSMQVLSERGEFALYHGRVSFAVLLMQDLAVVLFLVLLTTIGNSSTTLAHELFVAFLKGALALGFIFLLGRLVLKPLYQVIAQFKNPELFIAVTLLVILSTSLITNSLGLSMELGAFLAGLLLSESEYRHQVEADIQPFYGLLLGLFFMSVGMSIDLGLVYRKIGLMILALLLLLTIKASVLFLLCRMFAMPKASSLRVSLLLSTGGEFVFILLGPAMAKNLLSQPLGQFVYACVALSMALTPLLGQLGKYIADRWVEQEAESNTRVSLQEIGDLKDHIIVGGCGRVGKLVADILAKRMIPFVMIDNDMSKVSAGRAKGLPVFYGDARRLHMLRALGGDKARAAVISLNRERFSYEAALMMTRQFPQMAVCVRMRNDRYEKALKEVGATIVMPENLEPSLQLAQKILLQVGTPMDEALQIIEKYRRKLTPEKTPEDPKTETSSP